MNLVHRYLESRKKKSGASESENEFSAPETIGERLAFARIAAGKTQDEAAQHVGLSGRSMISRFEKGTRFPSIEMLNKLADFYRIDPNQLVPEAERQKYFLSKENSTAKTTPNLLPANTVPLKIEDDNMAPLLLRGDIIWIEPILHTKFQSGLACVKIDGSVKACWLTKNANGFIGLQMHPDYFKKPFAVASESVFGVVVELHRRFFQNQ